MHFPLLRGFGDPVYWTKNLEGYGILALKLRGIRDLDKQLCG